MAYVGYESRFDSSSRAARPNQARLRLAWGRLAAVAASLVAWIGIIGAVRAILF